MNFCCDALASQTGKMGGSESIQELALTKVYRFGSQDIWLTRRTVQRVKSFAIDCVSTVSVT